MITGTYSKIAVERWPTGVHVAKAWGTSRPNDQTSKLEDVIKIDVPVNEIEDFILVVKAPIIIREMLFTVRDHVAWARTSRVDDLTKWEVFKGYEDHPEVGLLYDTMQAKMVTETQDNFRDCLPLVYMTEFTLKLSARTLFRIHDAFITLVSGMIRDLGRGTSPMLAMFSQFGMELKQALCRSPYGDVPVGAYGNLDLLPKAQSLPDRDKATRLGDFVHVALQRIPITLRAQIVRHRPITFVDTLVDYLTEGAITAPINSKVSLAMVMPAAMAHSMLTKRNCWIAQEDLWLPVIKALNDEFGDDGAFALPCDKGYCPVARDNLLRHEAKDPAPACPIWYNLEGIDPSAQQRADIMGYMSKRTYSKGMWENIYMQNIPDPGA